jgi:hypothetical protein
LRVAWTTRLNDAYNIYHVVSEIPDWRVYKETIITWMYLWPFSMIGTLFADLLIKFWENVCEWMGGLYDSIAKAVWSGVEKDFASDEDKAIVAAAQMIDPDKVAETIRNTSITRST